LSVAVQKENEELLRQTGASGGATFLLAGQIGNEPHGLYLIHPQCKVIKATPEKPLICGSPLELVVVPAGSLSMAHQIKVEAGDPSLNTMIDVWIEAQREYLSRLPSLPCEKENGD
jgi:putative proteasome-type protease